MKWINHRVVTGAAIYAVTENLLWTACGILGSVWPDKVEGMPNNGNWRKRHRGVSHWALLYLALIGIAWQLPKTWALTENFNLRSMIIFFFIGALFHIAEDAVCGKVPLLTPKKKYGVRLFKVGTPGEYIFAVAIIVLVYLAKYNF